MILNERYRQFPIKIYKKSDGTIFYENKFMNGTADKLSDAFDNFTNKNFEWDLFDYYYDVLDLKWGTFEPAIVDKKYKNMTYLGKINLALDINPSWETNEGPDKIHTVTHLSKNPNDIQKQKEFIQLLKSGEKKKEFIFSIKKGIEKLKSFFTGSVNETNLQEAYNTLNKALAD